MVGHGVVRDLFRTAGSDRLRAFLVWIPMVAADTVADAEAEARTFRDPRAVHGWDESRAIGRAVAGALGVEGTAWDVYLAYAAGVRWDGDDPPAPTFWMHQLGPKADPAPALDAARFGEAVRGIVARIE